MLVLIISLVIGIIIGTEAIAIPESVVASLSTIFPDVSGFSADGDIAFIIFLKFLLFILFYALVFVGLGTMHLFKEKESKKIKVVLAAVIGLMATILLSDNFVVGLFQSYSWLFAAAALLAPAVIGIILMYPKKKEHEETFFTKESKAKHFVRGILWMMIAYLYASLGAALLIGFRNADIVQWSGLGATVAFVFGMICFIFAFLSESK